MKSTESRFALFVGQGRNIPPKNVSKCIPLTIDSLDSRKIRSVAEMTHSPSNHNPTSPAKSDELVSKHGIEYTIIGTTIGTSDIVQFDAACNGGPIANRLFPVKSTSAYRKAEIWIWNESRRNLLQALCILIYERKIGVQLSKTICPEKCRE